MISCKKVASVLMSDQMATSSWTRRLEIRLHLAFCTLCSRLARQLRQIRSAARQGLDTGEPDADLEERIVRHLSKR